MMGAAVATVIGQAITAVLAIRYLLNMKNIRPAKSDYALNIHICGKTLLLGITSFLSQISLVAAMAVVGIVMKFFQIVISIVVGMAAGCIPIVGFNIGAGQNKRVKGTVYKTAGCRGCRWRGCYGSGGVFPQTAYPCFWRGK